MRHILVAAIVITIASDHAAAINRIDRPLRMDVGAASREDLHAATVQVERLERSFR